jgi:hypothetical protein
MKKMSTRGGMHKAKQGIPSSGPPDERLNGEMSFIERMELESAACDV